MNLLQQLKKADTGSLPAMEQQALQNFLHPTDSQVNEAHAYQWLKHVVNTYNHKVFRKILHAYESYLSAQVNNGFNTIDETDLPQNSKQEEALNARVKFWKANILLVQHRIDKTYSDRKSVV